MTVQNCAVMIIRKMDLLRKVMEIFSAGQIRKKTGQSNTLSFFAGSFQSLIFEQCKLLKPGAGAPI